MNKASFLCNSMDPTTHVLRCMAMVQQPEYGNLQDESRSFFLLPSQLDIVFSPFIYLKSYLDGGVGVK